MYFPLLILAWIIALLWTWQTLSALRNLPLIPNLLDPRYGQPLPPQLTPILSVIVPASNEAASVEATLRSLIAIDSIPLEILAIDDRSTDTTGAIMDSIAAETDRLAVIHITELPAGWTGKTHAMALAARQATAPWLLFTDADVLFAPDSLLRAINLVQAEQVDHLAVFPTFILKTFGERMMLAVFQIISTLGTRFWMVSNPRSRASVGIGAFNLIRASAYRSIGGFESLRMEVLEDVRLGFTVKRAGFRQQIVFGPDLIRIRWAEGAFHFVRNLTKNLFAVFQFRALPALAACAVLIVALLGPVAALAGPLSIRIPGAIVFLMLLLLYRYHRRLNGIPTAYFLTYPVAAALLIYAVLRSIIVTLLRGGVRWRGTFYSLAELRENCGPIH
jgi:glycosyltransferase involved in cell wall biosynthesis